MELSHDNQKKMIIDYCNLIITEGSKEFIIQYEYYLTLFSVSDYAKKKDFMAAEKNFILFTIYGIQNQIKILNPKLILTEHLLKEQDTSIFFIYRMLVKQMSESRINNVTNPYPRIFYNDFAYNFFEQIKQTVTNDLADFSFIYRKMINDKLIFERVGDSEFRSWLSSKYEIEIDKMKQLHNCTTDKKEQFYTMIKDSIQQE
jgi:hypothetical protein